MVAQTSWTRERTDALCNALRRNPQALVRELAALLGDGVTRCAIIGKLRRLRLAGVDLPRLKHRGPPRPAVNNKPRRYSPRPRAQLVMPHDEVLEMQEMPEPEPPRQQGKISFLQLRQRHCRWPSGDRPPFMFCGAPRQEGRPYCAKHCKIAYSKRPA